MSFRDFITEFSKLILQALHNCRFYCCPLCVKRSSGFPTRSSTLTSAFDTNSLQPLCFRFICWCELRFHLAIYLGAHCFLFLASSFFVFISHCVVLNAAHLKCFRNYKQLKCFTRASATKVALQIAYRIAVASLNSPPQCRANVYRRTFIVNHLNYLQELFTAPCSRCLQLNCVRFFFYSTPSLAPHFLPHNSFAVLVFFALSPPLALLPIFMSILCASFHRFNILCVHCLPCCGHFVFLSPPRVPFLFPVAVLLSFLPTRLLMRHSVRSWGCGFRH